MRNGKGLANGVKKEVWFFIFDKESKNSPFASINQDRRRSFLKKLEEENITPDFIVKGSEHHCGKEIARRCFKLGYSSVKDFLDYAKEANFAEANVQADVLQKKMDSFKDDLEKVLQSKVK